MMMTVNSSVIEWKNMIQNYFQNIDSYFPKIYGIRSWKHSKINAPARTFYSRRTKDRAAVGRGARTHN